MHEFGLNCWFIGMQYPQYVQIREYHRRHPSARVIDANEEYEEVLKEEPRIEFTGEVDFFLSIF